MLIDEKALAGAFPIKRHGQGKDNGRIAPNGDCAEEIVWAAVAEAAEQAGIKRQISLEGLAWSWKLGHDYALFPHR
jgi:hypothetical protein